MNLPTETTEQSVVFFHQAAVQPKSSNSMLATTCKRNSPLCQSMLDVWVVCPSQLNRMLQSPNSKNMLQFTNASEAVFLIATALRPCGPCNIMRHRVHNC